MLQVHDRVSFLLWMPTQICYEQVALARPLEPLMTNSWMPAGNLKVAEKMGASILARLIFLWPSRELAALTRYSLLLCRPALRYLEWFEKKTQRFLESLCRWSSSLKARQMVVEQQCYPY